MYSTDMAFTQHKHDKYSLQTKDQKLADKEIIKRHVKLHMEEVNDLKAWTTKKILLIDLFRLYILFSQYRSCDDTQEI